MQSLPKLLLRLKRSLNRLLIALLLPFRLTLPLRLWSRIPPLLSN
jgi:hypothetical protein